MLVAVSGGADSTALLLALHSIAGEHGLDMRVAHLNHGLRGGDSDADQAFVVALAGRLGLDCHTARWRTRQRMRRRGLTGENGLRVLRREYLERVRRRYGADFIATAHTADDQLETILFRLARGSGLLGLGGMRPRSGRWIKPLLDATRADIESDLQRAGETWRTDASNAVPDVARNRMRLEVVPSLLSLFGNGSPAGRTGLARRVSAAAAELREAHDLLGWWACRRAPARMSTNRKGFSLPVDSLGELPRILQSTALSAGWRRLDAAAPPLSRAHQTQLARLIRGARGPVALPGGYEAVRQGTLIRVRPGGIQAVEPASIPATGLDVPGYATSGGLRVTSRWVSGRQAREKVSDGGASREYFAAEEVRGGLELRPARADETFVPFGRVRPVRVGEFLHRQSVRFDSPSSPTVLADDTGILWLIGVRRSARAPVSVHTRRALCVTTERHA